MDIIGALTPTADLQTASLLGSAPQQMQNAQR